MINALLTLPVRTSTYRCVEAWSTMVYHRPSGRQLFIQGNAGFIKGALTVYCANTVHLNVGQLRLHSSDHCVTALWVFHTRTMA